MPSRPRIFKRGAVWWLQTGVVLQQCESWAHAISVLDQANRILYWPRDSGRS